MTPQHTRGLLRGGLQTVGRVASALGLIGAARWARRTLLRRFHVVILTYHRVDTAPDPLAMIVGPERFAAHLDYLGAHYRVVGLEEAVRRMRAPGGLREDLAVVTFDDGYRDNLTVAWPLLRARGMPACLFATTGAIDGSLRPWFLVARRLAEAARRLPPAPSDPPIVALARRTDVSAAAAGLEVVEALKRLEPDALAARLAELEAAAGCRAADVPCPPFLGWDELRQMVAEGLEVGGHTVSHPILSRLARIDADREILECLATLRRQLGRPVVTFAYPNGHPGDFTPGDVACLERAGCVAACTTSTGFNVRTTDPRRLRRLGIGNDPPEVFAAKVEGFAHLGYRVRDMLASERRAVA